jgi:hypothetical protein
MPLPGHLQSAIDALAALALPGLTQLVYGAPHQLLHVALIVGSLENSGTDVMTGRNEIRMLGFFIVGIVFLSIGLFGRRIPVSNKKPFILKGYYRLVAIIIGANAIITALYIYWGR